MVLEEEECLYEGEQKVHDVDQNENITLAVCCSRGLEVRCDLQTIKGNTSKCER